MFEMTETASLRSLRRERGLCQGCFVCLFEVRSQGGVPRYAVLTGWGHVKAAHDVGTLFDAAHKEVLKAFIRRCDFKNKRIDEGVSP